MTETRTRTVLNKDIQALLDQQGRVEYNQTVTKRQYIVAGAHFEERTDGPL